MIMAKLSFNDSLLIKSKIFKRKANYLGMCEISLEHN